MSCKVRHAINSWFQDLVDRITKPVMELVGNTVLSTPNVVNQDRVKRLWTSADVAANSLMVLFALAGALLVMSHETLQTRYAAKEIAPRMVGAMVLANASLWLIGKAIEVANALSQAVMGQSVSAVGLVKTLIGIIVADVATDGIFTILLGLVAATMAVALLVSWFIRLAGVVLLAAGAPLALICHALPATDNLARLWWRAMMACLGIQVAQALVLIAGVKVFFSGNGLSLADGAGSSAGQAALVDLLVCVALFFILLKIPFWARQWVFGYRHSPVYRILRSALIYRGLRAVGVLGGPGGAALAGLGQMGQAASRVRGIGRGSAGRGGGGSASGSLVGRPGPRWPTGGGGASPGRGRSAASGTGRTSTARDRTGRSGQLELDLGLPRRPRARQLALPIRVVRVKRPAGDTASAPSLVAPSESGVARPAQGRQLRLPLGRLGPAQPQQLRLPFGEPAPSRPRDGRVGQLSLPLGLPKAPAQPRQLRLPLELPSPAGRQVGGGEPAPTSRSASSSASASSGSGGAPARPVGRQLALPIPRPARPVQLSLPFQPPIRRQRRI
ncbi:MAG: hypothetical protein ACJ73S_03510 [Mycobacteriales bacterium]